MRIFGLRTTIVLLILVLCAANLSAVPPYMWFATHSIERYDLNGCPANYNLGTCHEDAAGFAAAVNAYADDESSVWHRFDREDTACTAARWTGSTAETNRVDFLFYAGHGDGGGPFLGCSAPYIIEQYDDIRFGQSYYLKWVQAAACLWFTDSHNGKSKFTRWDPAFCGVHTVMGHKAVTFDHDFPYTMSYTFWSKWTNQGINISIAWLDAQILAVYTLGGKPGLCPYSMAPNSTYLREMWADAGDEKAPYGCTVGVYRVAGIPIY
jgi:hypothetical protein